MIRCMAIDDEPLALQQIVAYIGKVPFLELAAQCQSALEAKAFLEQDTVDAVFCDINMPDLNGMDFVKSLAVPPLIVFTTAYSEYAVEGFRVNAVDYLLKPFGLQDFQRAANRLKERLESSVADTHSVIGDSVADTLFLKTEYRIVKVNISDIRYIEAMSEYLKVYLQGEAKPIVTLLSLKKMEERLPDNFMRIHRSYIVNLNMIQEVNKNRIIMDADTYLPIGDLYKDTFQQYSWENNNRKEKKNVPLQPKYNINNKGKMKILLLGSGGREHALAWKIAQSEKCEKLYIAPGNAGTSNCGTNIPMKADDFEVIKQFVVAEEIDMVVVGPEDPLVKGIYDDLKADERTKNVPVIGPSKAGAVLEGSKDFAKAFMQRHNIPTARS